MRKIISTVAVAVLLSTSALFAEVSGAFLGLGVGYGNMKANIKYTESAITAGQGFDDTQKANGVSYGFVVGYKQFFTDYLGLRYYANVDLTHGNFKLEDPDTLASQKYQTTHINYGVNVDFLGNFVSNESLDFGGFIGLGIGGNTVTGKYINNIKDLLKANGVDKTKTTDFDIALNVGLRANIATNHGVEVAFRVPFMPITVANKSAVDELGTDLGKFKATLGQDVRFLARYTYSF